MVYKDYHTFMHIQQSNKKKTLYFDNSCDRWIRKAKFAWAQWDTNRYVLTYRFYLFLKNPAREVDEFWQGHRKP